MPSFKDLLGMKFGRLTVLGRAEQNQKKVFWNCKCDCGSLTQVQSNKLVSGRTLSCGCLQKERASNANKIHGHSCYPNGGKSTKEYNTWAMMLRRCKENAAPADKRQYFDRSIKVCERWANSFSAFFEDMGQAPSKIHSIDRINNNLGYSKQNCRWATPKEQARNKSTTKFLCANGETKTFSEWSEITGIPYKRIHARLRRGWSPEKTVNTPIARPSPGTGI